jgi:hypothetical protein
MRRLKATVVPLLFLYCLAGVLALVRSESSTTAASQAAPAAAEDAQAKDIAILKDKAPDQAHAMVSVAYHYNNLWFAGDANNWPLAEFYLNESRSHLKWAVRIIPVRKDSAGREIKLQDILQAADNTLLKELQESVKAKDHDRFAKAYKIMLDNGCYSCHKAVDKPYLRLCMPERPAEEMINFEPEAEAP